MGRNTEGVGGFALGDGEYVIAASVVPKGADGALAIVTTEGFAKRVEQSEIPTKGRNGGGVVMLKPGGKYGDINSAVFVADDGQVVYQEEKGKLKSIDAKEILQLSRATVPKPWPGEKINGFIS